MGDLSQIIYKLLINVPAFLFAIVAHEWAHAYVALKFGDDTAKNEGRLTLSPMAHIDVMGTIVWPIICLFLGGVVFGYAKPVPVNPSRFKKYRQGLFWVSFAGPLMNVALGIVSCFLYALVLTKMPQDFTLYAQIKGMLEVSVLINFVLAIFNLIPFPPLDGSKMVSSFLNYDQARKYEDLQRFSLIFLLVLWTTNTFSYLFMPVYKVVNVMTNAFIYTLT